MGFTRILGQLSHPAVALVAALTFGAAALAVGPIAADQARLFTIADDPKLVFDDDRGKIWDEAVARRQINL